MLTRNLLKAGDYVEPLPLGLPITIQYDESGKIVKVWEGFESNLGDPDKQLLGDLIKYGKLPLHVDAKNGTVFVRGVVYTGKKYDEVLGSLPTCIFPSIKSDIHQNYNFNFFAVSMEAKNMNFVGSMQIRNWLNRNGFLLIPGFVIANSDVELYIRNQLQDTAFNYEDVFGYFIFRGTNSFFGYLTKHRDKITHYNRFLDNQGYEQCKLTMVLQSEYYISSYMFDYWSLSTGSIVEFDANGLIIQTYPKASLSIMQFNRTCSICGKHYIAFDEFSRCGDIHCLSRSYFDILHFLRGLNLPEISYDVYMDNVKNKNLTVFSDILGLSCYQDFEINISYYQLLDAIIPISAVRNRSVIYEYCTRCNNSWETIEYYMDHCNFIEIDLNLKNNELVNWFSDVYNRNCVKDILLYTNVVVSSELKKFDGSPIFRDKNIYLTGKFSHGNIEEVSAILRSYSAKITDYVAADCAIIGDIPENINGSHIKYIESKGLPVFNESEFFSRYEIDEDLV